VRVRSTKAREAADFDVDDASRSTSLPTGSPTEAKRRVDAGEHPVHHSSGQRIALGEVLVGGERDLAGAPRRS